MTTTEKHKATPPVPPIAEKKPQHFSTHNRIREDNYAWLRSKHWQEVLKNPHLLEEDIKAYLDAENAYQQAFMEKTETLQKTLFSELKARIKEDDSTIPEKDGPYAYGICYNVGSQQPAFYRTPREGGEKFVYLDAEKEGLGKDYFQLGSVVYAPDHEKFLWTFDDKGSEFFTLKIGHFGGTQSSDPTQGQDLKNVGPHAVWDKHAEGIFYTKLDENHRPYAVYYHKLGTELSEDRCIYQEKESGFFLSVAASRLKDYIYIDIHDHETSEVWLIKAAHPLAPPICVKKREKGVEYSLTEGEDRFYILTNKDGAKDFKIMSAPVETPFVEYWQDVISHKEGRLIVSHEAYAHHLVWLVREESLPKLIIKDRRSGEEHQIVFEEEAYSLGLIGAKEYASSSIRFSYASMTTPKKLFSYDMETHERKVLKIQEVPSGHNAEAYITRRIMAPTKDGSLVPISLYYHKDTKLDGSAPCLLYGYGAYGISIPASFNTNTLSLVNRGFIYAIAHIRGGKEKGAAWYENGKHLHKKNSFYDFIEAGRYLVEKRFTQHDRLIAYGGSAGGMLMGAVANIAPADYKAIIALVPFVDVLNTMLDATLPLTPPEWPEWGNPIESQRDYDFIASYSPYDNVTQQDYPAILAIAGLTDPRVTYWEAAKWVAKLRAYKTNDTPILLRTNMSAGHGGAAGRFARLEETAYIYAYILKILGYPEAE